MTPRGERGFTMVEALLALALLALVVSLLGSFMVDGLRRNRTEQKQVAVQDAARTVMDVTVRALRSAGWDPENTGLTPVTLDATGTWIETRADLDPDGSVDPDETLRIRHVANRVELRRTPTGAFDLLGANITNDEDADGTAEPMFTADSVTNPTRITVKVTARSAEPDVESGRYAQYTLVSTVHLRNAK